MRRLPLLCRVEDYLALRRREGYALLSQGWELRSLARFAGRTRLTPEIVARWSRSTRSANPLVPGWRLRPVRGFARYLAMCEQDRSLVGLFRRRSPAAPGRTPQPRTWLQARIGRYVTMRRRLGYRLTTQATLLRSFGRFASALRHEGPLTVEIAVRWAKDTRSRDPAHATRRLGAVRAFARHLAAFDPRTEVPPAGLLGHPTRRKPPHVYSEAELAALLRTAAALGPRGGLRPHTYVAFLSLLASTGLRPGEACRLECEDVDLVAGLLTVRASKFRKSRLVPLHPSAIEPLRRYGARRDSCASAARSEFFFRADHAPRLTNSAIDATFARLRARLGWSAKGRARIPRIQDLRHTFAVRRLLRWCKDRVDVDRRIAHLATYLGHAGVTGTYWYLTAVPELMAVTAGRFERYVGGARGGAL